MTERFYAFDEITNSINCLEYAISTLGLKPVDNKDHFNCPWRAGSDSESFQIGDKAWTDHTQPQDSEDRSGNVISLCARLRHSGDLQAAQEELGDMLGIDPHMQTKVESVGRAASLTKKGYRATVTYDYHDADTGEIAHQVTRYEHADHGKEFIQHTPSKPTIKGVKTFLYRYNDWKNKPTVMLVEGEKDADNVAALGLPATTNPSGAGHWQERWSDMLRGKSVIIVEDNDPAGRQRSQHISYQLKNYVADVKILRLPDLPVHGDISDWIDAQDDVLLTVTQQRLIRLVSETETIAPDDIPNPSEDYESVMKAKELNKYELKNYYMLKSEDETEPPKQVPIHINKLTSEIHDRFLGFPRRQGGTMFDHDKESGDVVFIDRQSSLFAWIQRKSKKAVRWGRKEGSVSRDEMFESLRADAIQYSSISKVPDWPSREDVYYAHNQLPAPTENHQAFWGLVNKFSADSFEDYALIAAYVMSPIFYKYAMARPMWIIDASQTGSGKTTLATTVALLFGAPPIEVKQRDLMRDTQEITKRMISPTGRQGRICLVDNVTGTFGGEEFASIVTMPEITGRPVHGRDEESRPNNLTYTVTTNNASISDDIAVRSWIIHLKRPDQYKADWSEKLVEYVNVHRMQIFADMIDMLENHEPYDCPVSTRFPEVEERLLQACCNNFEEYSDVIKMLFNRTAAANAEEEFGKAIEDAIRENLAEAKIHPDKYSVFIRSSLLAEWVGEVIPQRGNAAVQAVRSLATQGHISSLDSKINIWPPSGDKRRRGAVWKGRDYDIAGKIDFSVDKRGRKVVALNKDNSIMPEEFFLQDADAERLEL